MPVIANADAKEIPWRPGYRNFVLAGRDQGLNCVAGFSVLQPGAGAPLHAHKDADEVFIVLEGSPTLVVDGREIETPAGTFARLDPDLTRTVVNYGDEPAAVLIVSAPRSSGYEPLDWA